LEQLDLAVLTVHPHPIAGVESQGRIPAPDHGPNTQLACDDGGVRERRADVGDDGRGARERISTGIRI
jgi:hypothetical protein